VGVLEKKLSYILLRPSFICNHLCVLRGEEDQVLHFGTIVKRELNRAGSGAHGCPGEGHQQGRRAEIVEIVNLDLRLTAENSHGALARCQPAFDMKGLPGVGSLVAAVLG